MILLIDNYDSFTYNLYQYLTELGGEVEVHRNDQISVEDCLSMGPERVVISPGPCSPKEAGISIDLVTAFAGRAPLLGVCLGHQCIGEAYGGVVEYAGEIMHGKTSLISHDGRGVFDGLEDPFEAIRYHSLAIRPDTVPDVLEVSARSESGVIMGVRHREFAMEGVQFHPESIMTKHGHDLLRNFLRMPNVQPAGAAS
ncbi:MAG: aminodeoxychorismate/anthranilate synthase component II [Chloroflexi bacterium]|nr:aminodeoxychorismate/anthranilate synthase component II [Chloroflexota bacterium]MDA1009887.1 aminodeoxychorismate/anthranilate synthase component II [Chloroflexota bacterium]MQC25320.1 aminodeoxychorismate/anthranilate synthase component II [Chloroflexota bacterium]MQC47478.1 aminodeoxychorismate/anthranilate synthase component II [Chloroflexota bacterium]